MVATGRPAALPTLFLFFSLFFVSSQASDPYPRAQNVTWKSTNFKTILTWEPEPSENYSFTVEFSSLSGDKQRSRHCIRSSAALCDLSGSLSDLQACYTADVLSEPPRGASSDIIEFPHTRSPRFCPYKDTDIGRPDFKLQVSDDKKKTTLYVEDPLTAIFKDGRQLNIRDVFSDQLLYRVTYRRNKSTGRKTYDSRSSAVELVGLDRGESYCFSVQAFIPSRGSHKQLGEPSATRCSAHEDQSIFEVYSAGVIAAAIFLVLLLVGLVVAVTVVCCKRRKNARKSGKEGVPLRDV
ncbi:coagulation factor IIIa [Pseudoliparis swirei]|uniref:coagulation factor IIIa n=1 Tax=Pseudoliparis swirei TaxID=2059687 RepID=UPI0024BD9537|nr:coagulation factor IIIa [Pseudoliparis swirei]